MNDQDFESKLKFYAKRQPVPVTLREMFEFARSPNPQKQIMYAQFLHNELPVRVAKRVWDLRRLPHGLSEMASMQTVRECYERSFARLASCPLPTSSADEAEFFNMIQDIKAQDTHDQELISNALRELIGVCVSGDNPDESEEDIFDFSNFLDVFYMSRI